MHVPLQILSFCYKGVEGTRGGGSIGCMTFALRTFAPPYFRTVAPPISGHLLFLFSDICSKDICSSDICSLSQFCSGAKADVDSASINDLKKICKQFLYM